MSIRRSAIGVVVFLLAWPLAAFSAESAPSGYSYYSIGEINAPTPRRPGIGLMLMGGGGWVKDAFHWLVEKAGGGHFVILRASGADDLQKELYQDIGGVASVETIVFTDRKAASDPRVLAIVRHADGIFLAGGDQAKYVRFWKGTPLNRVLDAHVRAAKPIGGSSAGLAILGGYSYGALDGDSLASHKALSDPLGPGVTLVRNFLHLPFLRDVITDSHFGKRARLGRLVVFVARLIHEEHKSSIAGIGIDEATALCIDGQGMGRVFTESHGSAWLVRPARAADRIVAGQPLEFRGVPIVGIGPSSSIDLRTLEVTHPAFEMTASTSDGAIQMQLPAGSRWSLAIHGGAGVIERGELSAEREAEYRNGLSAALEAGSSVLRAGGSSLDAVEATIRVLEDDPHFNAGRGAVFTADGRNELDASIMYGADRAAGAVAGVTRTRNPIVLARAVMDHSGHVMLAGDGADTYSKEQELERVDPAYFRTEERWRQLQDWRKDKHLSSIDRTHLFGTVGAVALDAWGHVAAGTSTGGLTGKRWGRIGDSPIIGAGTYAADGICAVSATGTGEYFIRASAARQTCDRIAYGSQSVQQALDTTIADIAKMGGDGGMIAIDGAGNVAFSMNTSGMYRGWVNSSSSVQTAIYWDEHPSRIQPH
jgi:beta-aspartyl-peptidase (threonine type)